MKTSTQVLPGITFIGWLDSRKLPDHVALSGICGMAVAVLTDIHKVPFFDDPQCECTTKKDGAGYQDTATLKFLSDLQIPNNGFLAFVVTDVTGKSFLIGSKEPPLVIVEKTRQAGTPSGDPAGFSYEISHVSIKSMVPCVI